MPNHTAPATTRAVPSTNRPAPSRRCSGSRSRAPWPTLRAMVPIPWAIASQRAATPLRSARERLATGPRPLRTARGAGRAELPRGAGLRAVVDAGRLVVPALRARVLGARPPLEEDVLLLRDPGGEDVRVAM